MKNVENSIEDFTTKNERLMKIFTDTENIILEIGKALIPTAKGDNSPSLINEIKKLRVDLQESHGLEMDKIRIRDNVKELKPFEYQIIKNNMIVTKKTVESELVSAQIDHMITNLKALILK